jgi:hypothetical protein
MVLYVGSIHKHEIRSPASSCNEPLNRRFIYGAKGALSSEIINRQLLDKAMWALCAGQLG